jgi:hypothetical protein
VNARESRTNHSDAMHGEEVAHGNFHGG